jgi:hypothetical protein
LSKRSDKLRRDRQVKRLEKEEAELQERLRKIQREQEEDRKRVEEILTRLWNDSGMKGTPERASDLEWALVFWTEYRRGEYSKPTQDFVGRKMAPYSFLFSEAREEFGRTWRGSSYARLSLGHKVGAALALTSAPEGEVRSPWEAWSLQVPDQLLTVEDELGMTDELSPQTADVQRIFCLGSEPAFALARTEPSKKFVVLSHAGRERPPVWWELMRNLVKGVCLVLGGTTPGRGGRWSSPTRGRRGPPPGEQYELRKEVTIDLRQELKRVLRGEREGASPSFQFLVRGHWRNQAHGEGRSLRRRQWIEPFWKGPEEARVLLRGHVVKG